MNGCMTCNFMYFLTLFQSYQDSGRLIVKSCVIRNPFEVGKISASSVLEPPLDQLAIA